MSLQLWLPLISDARNLGLKSNITFENVNSADFTTGSGKIGATSYECTSTAGMIWHNGNDFNYIEGDAFSWCIWVWYRHPDAAASFVFTNGRADYGGLGYGLQSAGGDSMNAWYGSQYWNFIVPTASWHHIAFTKTSDNKIKIYVDGSLVVNTTFSGTHPTYSDGAGLGLGGFRYNGGNIYPYYGDLNDFRIYDHALSTKEVREISKGLVLHYNFEDPYVEGTTNLASQTEVGGWNNNGTATWNNPDTTISNKPCINSKVISLYKNDDGNSCITFGNCGDTSIRGQSVTASTWVYLEGNQSGEVVYLRSGTHDNAICYLSYNGDSYVPNWPKNQWIHISGTGTVASDESYVYFCTYLDIAGEKRAFNGWQLEQKDHATPYVNGTRQPGILYDSSGYGRNGTPMNNPQIVDSNGGSGNKCAKLIDANTYGYFDLGTKTFNFIDNGAVCFWAKYPTNSNKMIFGANDNGARYLGAYNSTDDVWYSNLQGGSQGSIYCDGVLRNKPIFDENWHFYCFNGVNLSNWGDFKYFLCIYANNPSNDYQFHGYLADFKLFATALSASDILAEYNRKAAIDRIGNIFSGEFVEQAGTAKIATKKNQVIANQFVEGTDKTKVFGGYTELSYIESTGTQWIDTGIISGDNVTRLEAHYYKTTVSRMQILFGMYTGNSYGYSYLDYTEGDTILRGTWNGATISTGIEASEGEVKSSMVINGTAFTYTYNDRSFNGTAQGLPYGTTHQYLFADNDNGNPIYLFKCKLYSFKIFVDSKLSRNFIPVKRNRDNAIGLFDTITRKFFANSGSGSFTAGNELGELSIICSNEVNEL